MPLAEPGSGFYDPPAMRTLDRYIRRQSLALMVFVTGALSVAVWVAQSLRLIDLIVNRGLSIELFLYLALLILPRFLDVVLPIGVFIAVLFTFNRLAMESELVVMRAAGLSPLSLARPVLEVAVIGCIVLTSLSVYFLPEANRAFKDLEFEIRNRFVSSLVEEGTFTTVADKITFYARSRDARGDVAGLMINDDRDPRQPVTILAERAAFVDTPAGPRIVMINGSRQQYDPATKELSVLTFARYTLDLGTLHDTAMVRYREAAEHFLPELLSPPAGLNPVLRKSFIAEGNQRILIPLSVFSFALIPLACLLPGELDRRGYAKRVALAIGLAFTFELVELGAADLAARFSAAIPLTYLVVLLPIGLGLAILQHRGIRPGLRRPALAAGGGT
jgi:lipopolysaccharide export system permease protein